jgi:FkbM family methyltransferase
MVFDRVWHLPDGETHLPHWMTTTNRRVDGRLTYQYDKYQTALGYCPSRRVALDIGAHVGLWSYWMARDFFFLHAFEPRPEHCACWRQNVPRRTGVQLHEVALGDRVGTVALDTPLLSSGDTCIDLTASTPTIPMRRLDDYAPLIIDLIKVDCEGFELFVLRGGHQLLRWNRPVVLVEQKPGKAQRYGLAEREAITYLESLGGRVRCTLSGDFIITFGGGPSGSATN